MLDRSMPQAFQTMNAATKIDPSASAHVTTTLSVDKAATVIDKRTTKEESFTIRARNWPSMTRVVSPRDACRIALQATKFMYALTAPMIAASASRVGSQQAHGR